MNVDLFEQKVIGAICLDHTVFSEAIRHCSASDFDDELFRTAFEVATDLDNSGQEWDVSVLRDGICRAGHFSPEMVDPALKSAMDAAPSATEVSGAAKAVKRDSDNRALQDLAGYIQDSAFHRAESQEIIQTIETRVECLKRNTGAIQAPQDTYRDFLLWFSDQLKSPGAAFVKTGYSELDRVLCGGFIKSGLYVFGARPGMGKTTVILNIAEKISKQGNVLFISLEMDANQILAKRTAIMCRVPYSSIVSGRLKDDEMNLVLRSQPYFLHSPFYIYDSSATTIQHIEALARSIPDLGILFVDYLGVITPADSDAQKPKNEQTAAISAGLKRIAKRLNIPVVVACQLNRESVKSVSKRPSLTDLRDSGAIEQDADGVILLYRDGYFEDEKPETENIDLIIAKNRHGMTGTITLRWEAKTGFISEYIGNNDGILSEI